MELFTRRAVGALTVILVAVGSTAIGTAAAARPDTTAGVEQAAFKKTFSGSGNRNLGTLRLRRSAVLRWRTRGGLFQVSERHSFLLVNTRARRGHVRIHRGTYRGVRVATRGRWTITVRSR